MFNICENKLPSQPVTGFLSTTVTPVTAQSTTQSKTESSEPTESTEIVTISNDVKNDQQKSKIISIDFTRLV